MRTTNTPENEEMLENLRKRKKLQRRILNMIEPKLLGERERQRQKGKMREIMEQNECKKGERQKGKKEKEN